MNLKLKTIILIFGMIFLSAGVIYAITGATTGTHATAARWVTTATSDTTEGGNLSQQDLSVNMLTDKWAAYYGNLTGNIVLRPAGGSNDIYNWTWNSDGTDVGEVCLSTNSAFGWASAVATNVTDIAALNDVWLMGTDANSADNANSTYNDGADCNINLVQSTVTNTKYATHKGLSSFKTCVLHNGALAAETDFAFCTNINVTGKNYNNVSYQYETLVPTSHDVNETETYWFYLELE